MRLAGLFVILFLFTAGSVNAHAHEYYVGITNMEYNERSGNLEVIIKLSGHDVEYAIHKEMGRQLHLGSAKEPADADQILAGYILRRFAVSCKNELLDAQFLGKEIGNDDQLVIYIEIPVSEAPDPSKLKVKNGILMGYFPRQENVIHYTTEEKTYTSYTFRDKRTVGFKTE